MIVRTLGAPRTVMAAGGYDRMMTASTGANLTLFRLPIYSDTATNCTTTGAISPDAKVTIDTFTNNPVLTTDGGYMDVTGLV